MWVSASCRASASRAELGGLASGAVRGLAGAVGVLLGERGLVHEQVGFVCGDLQRLARRGVAREDDLAPLAFGAHDLLGQDAADGLAALQAAEVGAGLDAELLGELGVEVAGARVLDDRVAEGDGRAVADGHGGDQVTVALDALRRLELDDFEARTANDRR